MPLLERLRFLCIVGSNLDDFSNPCGGAGAAAAHGTPQGTMGLQAVRSLYGEVTAEARTLMDDQ